MTLDTVATEIWRLVEASQANFPFTLALVASLWVIHFLNAILGYRLLYLGIMPRHIFGVIGIVVSPFLHASVEHLFLNSIPLLVLINLILIKGHILFYQVSTMVILITGFLIWAFGRTAIHVGASGIIMGFWSYLVVNAYYQPSVLAVVLAVVCVYYFGGVIINMFVFEKGVSWEGHVFGFIAGVMTAYLPF